VNDTDSFWIFQNGRTTMAQGFEMATHKYTEYADDTVSELQVFTITFCVIELVLLVLLGIVVAPLIIKSEMIFRSVLKVFNVIEQYIVKYL
jgi:ABC-type spermidine/putrescine transport system permease subunit I